MHPAGLEPTITDPKSVVISISLRVQLDIDHYDRIVMIRIPLGKSKRCAKRQPFPPRISQWKYYVHIVYSWCCEGLRPWLSGITRPCQGRFGSSILPGRTNIRIPSWVVFMENRRGCQIFCDERKQNIDNLYCSCKERFSLAAQITRTINKRAAP